jgi:hypothetical protein
MNSGSLLCEIFTKKARNGTKGRIQASARITMVMRAPRTICRFHMQALISGQSGERAASFFIQKHSGRNGYRHPKVTIFLRFAILRITVASSQQTSSGSIRPARPRKQRNCTKGPRIRVSHNLKPPRCSNMRQHRKDSHGCNSTGWLTCSWNYRGTKHQICDKIRLNSCLVGK